MKRSRQVVPAHILNLLESGGGIVPKDLADTLLRTANIKPSDVGLSEAVLEVRLGNSVRRVPVYVRGDVDDLIDVVLTKALSTPCTVKVHTLVKALVEGTLRVEKPLTLRKLLPYLSDVPYVLYTITQKRSSKQWVLRGMVSSVAKFIKSLPYTEVVGLTTRLYMVQTQLCTISTPERTNMFISVQDSAYRVSLNSSLVQALRDIAGGDVRAVAAIMLNDVQQLVLVPLTDL